MTRATCLAFLALSACAIGPVRRAHVDALGEWEEVRSVSVMTTADTPPELAVQAVPAAQSTLLAKTHLIAAQPGDPNAFRVEVRAKQGFVSGLEATLVNLTGGPPTKLTVEASLFAPDGEPRGYVRWEKIGRADTLATGGGNEAGRLLAEGFNEHRNAFFDRRAADERIFMTQTPSVLMPGEVYVNNDEGLLFSAGVGIAKRVQLNILLGGLPIPIGGATIFPIHGLAAVAGGALGVLGAFDLGVKVHILDESQYVPGLSVSYDMVDAFGAVVGAGAGVVLGDGILIAAAPGVAGANVQLNVFTIVVGKHFGHTEVNAGAYIIDNHNFLPQSAGFAVGVVSNAGVAGASGLTAIPRLPTTVQPFVAVEQVLGPHSALAVELFPRLPVQETFGTTGVRWLLGWDEPYGILALDRIRLRLDLAAVWVYMPPTPSKTDHKGLLLPVPYLGLGLYFM